MIARTAEKTLKALARGYPVVAVTGPRQSGKTTLVKLVFPDKPYVLLEELDQRESANEDPRGFLSRFPEGAVLDEVHHCPSLFSYIQGIADKDNRSGLFILTGSQQFGLLSGITQSLAGRVGLLQLLPLSIGELDGAGKILQKTQYADELLLKGFYPPVYTRKISPSIWYANYVMTYIERDVRQMINIRDLTTFQRFIRLCAARTGQMLNLSSLANDCGITHNTAKAWLSILEASYIIFLLLPHHNNFNKRLVKTPKIYFFDTGLAAWLAGIQDIEHISIHPMRPALFETLIVSDLLKSRFNMGKPSNLYFWRDNTGNEIDLIIDNGIRLMPVEIKSGQTVTPDYMQGLNRWQAIAGTFSEKPKLVYGGKEGYVRSGIEILSWRGLPKLYDTKYNSSTRMNTNKSE